MALERVLPKSKQSGNCVRCVRLLFLFPPNNFWAQNWLPNVGPPQPPPQPEVTLSPPSSRHRKLSAPTSVSLVHNCRPGPNPFALFGPTPARPPSSHEASQTSATPAGTALNSSHGHHQLGLWLGCWMGWQQDVRHGLDGKNAEDKLAHACLFLERKCE